VDVGVADDFDALRAFGEQQRSYDEKLVRHVDGAGNDEHRRRQAGGTWSAQYWMASPVSARHPAREDGAVSIRMPLRSSPRFSESSSRSPSATPMVPSWPDRR
jgi:hypothetical protein